MKKMVDEIQHVRKLRSEGASLLEICNTTGISKSTAYGWIKDIPVPDKVFQSRRDNQLKILSKGRIDTQWKFREKRDQAYRNGFEEAATLMIDRLVRDFVCLYWGEGDKRSQGQVGIVNTDPVIVKTAYLMLLRFSIRKPECRLSASRNERGKLVVFWSETLGISADEISFQEKKQVSKRRAEFGLMTVRVNDTLFKCRLKAWLDWLKNEHKNGGVVQLD